MANYTTNYNLKKPLGSENYNVADQNGNMDLIDAAMKANADAIAKDEEGIAYRLGNTNTTGATLAVGTYVYVTGNTNGVSNGMYKVTTAIAANGSLTTSNLGSVPGGVANSLNSNITPQAQIELTLNSNYIKSGACKYFRIGRLVILTFSDIVFKTAITSSSEGNNIKLVSFPTGVSSWLVVFTMQRFNSNSAPIRLRTNGDGVYPWWSDIPVSDNDSKGWFAQVVVVLE